MSNAAEIAASFDSLNRKGVEPIPASLIRSANASKVYVFSVSPESYTRTIGLGTFIVPAKKTGQRVSDPLVFRATEFQSVVSESGPMRWVTSEGLDAANDIVQIGKIGDFTKYGLFVSMNEVPTEEEISRAEEARVNYLSRTVEDADGFYAVNGGMTTVALGNQQVTRSNISETHRKALKELGWDRPWAAKNIKMAACWNCGRTVMPSSAKCFNDGCGAPLKNQEAIDRFMAGDFEEPAKRGPGRPRISA